MTTAMVTPEILSFSQLLGKRILIFGGFVLFCLLFVFTTFLVVYIVFRLEGSTLQSTVTPL